MKISARTLTIFTLGIFLGTAISWSMLQGQNENKPQIPPEKTSYRQVVQRILPAVVSLKTNASRKAQSPTRPSSTIGYGSGVLVDPTGIVLTNYHVVRGASEVVVELHDGRKLTSKDIRSDSKTDLAIIILKDDKPFPTLKLGKSDQMEIGDRVLAVGAPFGLVGSVTSGIISGKQRSLKMNLYEDFIQTDAAINPGNSGGPLINLNGEVIGINTAIKSETGGFQGIGLAISSRLIRTVMPQLIKNGKVKRGYLGVQVQDITDSELAKRLGLSKDQPGVQVSYVFKNTPGYKGGLEEGDVIISIADSAIKDGKQMQQVIASLPLEQSLDLRLLRDGVLYKTTIVLKEQPSSYGRVRAVIPRGPISGNPVLIDKLKLNVIEYNSELARRLNYRTDIKGVMVAEIKSGSIADNVLSPGYVITHVEREATPTILVLKTTLEKASLERGILMRIYNPQNGVSDVLLRSNN